MPYDKNNIDDAKKKGIFDNNTLDPRILELSADEKNKMQKGLSKAQQNMTDNKENDPAQSGKKEDKRHKPVLEIELTIFEKIVVFFLTLFGLETLDQYKVKKIIGLIAKDLSKIKPPIYNYSNRRVTKFFAYKIYDLFTKIFGFRDLFEKTLDNKNFWENINLKKTGLEMFFEKMANINSEELDKRFGEDGLEKTINEIDNQKLALDTIEKSFYSYLYSIDKETIESINKNYTNLIYFKKLADYDFMQLFKRFDGSFTASVSPNFIDIPGDALLTYLKDMEEAIIQIDLSMDNISMFKILQNVAHQDFSAAGLLDEESVTVTDSITNNESKMTNNIILLFEILKELLLKKYTTLLIQIIKSDPLYMPSVMHTKYDLYKNYCETFEKRVKNLEKKIMKERKSKRIESLMKKIFPNVQWVGIYTLSLSEKLEQSNYLGFTHFFQITIINAFLLSYYDELVKNVLNIILLNGIFMENHFKKSVSETFYNMESFREEFKNFSIDISIDGASGKKLMGILSKKEENQSEHKKILERSIMNINGKSADLYEKFYSLFITIQDIIHKIYIDIDAKPPKNIRNIRGIGGLRNSKMLSYIEKSHLILDSIKEIIILFKE